MNNAKLTPAEEFLTIYNELDTYMHRQMRANQGVAHAYLIDRMAEKNAAIRNYKDELKQYARLRNAIIHNPFKREADPIAEPHEEIVRRYEALKSNILNPPKALSIAIPAANIYSTFLHAQVFEVMKTMSQKVYTYVPVLNSSNRIIGVFSENVVFSFLAKNETCAINGNSMVEAFKEFIPIDRHTSEYFEFLPKNALLDEVKDLFEKSLSGRKRLGVVFVTSNGMQNGTLIGMITSWDVAGAA